MTTARQKQSLGAYGERVAARHLEGLGMTVLDRNWRCEAGEIDLVLREDDLIVVCEVKTRRSVAFGHPLEAVDGAKVARLRRLAALWAAAHQVRATGIRIDMVGVLAPLHGAPQIEHVRGIG